MLPCLSYYRHHSAADRGSITPPLTSSPAVTAAAGHRTSSITRVTSGPVCSAPLTYRLIGRRGVKRPVWRTWRTGHEQWRTFNYRRRRLMADNRAGRLVARRALLSGSGRDAGSDAVGDGEKEGGRLSGRDTYTMKDK